MSANTFDNSFNYLTNSIDGHNSINDHLGDVLKSILIGAHTRQFGSVTLDFSDIYQVVSQISNSLHVIPEAEMISFEDNIPTTTTAVSLANTELLDKGIIQSTNGEITDKQLVSLILIRDIFKDSLNCTFEQNANEESAACDFMSGVVAYLNHYDTKAFASDVNESSSSNNSSCEFIKSQFFSMGQNYAEKMSEREVSPTLEECLAELSYRYGHFYPSEDKVLPDSMVRNAVHRACQFFNLPYVPIVNSDGTCEWSNDQTNPYDDVIGFDRKELKDLKIEGEESLTLIFSHECAHRKLQGIEEQLTQWQKELAADYFTGLQAGIQGIDVSNFETSIGHTEGDSSHPDGALRAVFIEKGLNDGKEHEDLTFEGGLEHFFQFFNEKSDLISEYTHQDLTDNDHDVNTHEGGANHVSSINDREWHMKNAEKLEAEAEHHEKEASEAAGRGDISKMNNQKQLANECRHKAADERKLASECTE